MTYGYSGDQHGIPCCPPLKLHHVCDCLDFDYRLIHTTTVDADKHPSHKNEDVQVEVKIRVHIELCSGALALGDLVYSTTLLPDEKVRLSTTDRRNRFTFDSETQRNERTEQTSEEHFYMSSISDFLSDVTVRDAKRSANNAKSASDTHVQINDFLDDIFCSPSIDISGSHDAHSTHKFLRELSQHIRASQYRAEMASRAASAVSIGEVHTRKHAEGESEDHFEASSREFANPNRCHAVTFFFYRINKIVTLKVTLESIECRVIDPLADTKVTNNSPESSEGPANVRPPENTIHPKVREEAQRKVEQSLVEAGLLTEATGGLSPQMRDHFFFEREFTLPTPGIIIKGCLDDCNICECEPRKSQEYRCYPDDDNYYRRDRDHSYRHERERPYRHAQDYSYCDERERPYRHTRDYSYCDERERPYRHEQDHSCDDKK